jgi:hypothetical protein
LEDSTSATVEAAVAKLAATKAEHRPILAIISTDPGMAAATRKALVLHLLQEEDEQVARIAALAGGGAAAASDVAAEAGGASSQGAPNKGLTVGSLRATPAAVTPGRLGTLRNE